jgi:hypothetical protein
MPARGGGPKETASTNDAGLKKKKLVSQLN